MADSSLLADLGEDETSTPQKAQANSLLTDLGGGTDWSNSDGKVEDKDTSNTPVTDEAITAALNVLRQAPRHVIQAAGQLMSNFGNNATPDFNINGSEGSGTGALYEGSKRVANELEEAVPNLKPVNQGPLDRIAGQGLEMGLTGIAGGPEAVLPSAVSGIAQQGVKEAGGGPLAQTAAAFTPFAPSIAAAATRGIVRGGPASGATMAESKAMADAAGLPSTVGSTSGNPAIRAYEAVASKLPGGGPLREARDIRSAAESSVDDIIKKIHPEYDKNPATPSDAGQEVARGGKETIARQNAETSVAKSAMDEAVGGEHSPLAAPRTSQILQEITHPTGIPEVDEAVTTAKTKAVARTVSKVEKEPPIPKSYTTDGEGSHSVKSESNAETHATEQANGYLKVSRHEVGEEGEGVSRLETLAHAATSKGSKLVSDGSISSAEANDYERLGRRGWTVTKNPNAEVTEKGRIISDSPKNPVYTVEAPSTKKTELTNNASGESSASQEAINRVAQEKAQGTRRFRVDPDGNAIPLTGVDAVDAKAPQGHAIVQVDKDGNHTILDRGGQTSEGANGLANRAKARGSFENPETPHKTSERSFSGEWTYDPATGKTEPVTHQKPQPEATTNSAELGDKTPWTFGGLRALRTNIGQQIGRATGAQKTQLQRIYGGISEDLKDFVASKGPDAEQKYEFFNATASQNAASREALNKIMKEEGGPGEIFTKAMRGSKEDAGRIARVMGAMDPKGQSTFRAVVIHRMGRPGGAQTAAFDPNTLLTNYDKMSVEGKNALFGEGKSAQLRSGLDALTDSLRDMKMTGRLRSGMAQAVAQGMGHGAGRGMTLLGSLFALKELGEPAFRMAESHPVAATVAGAGLGGVAAVNPIMSRVLTNPKVVSWLAQSTKAPKAMIPVLVTNLQNMGRKDKDAKDLADLIRNLPSGGANSTSTKQSTPSSGEAEDGSDFVNPGKMTDIRLPGGRTIQGVDPSTFGSRFDNPKENPKSRPPDLPPQASDYTPAR